MTRFRLAHPLARFATLAAAAMLVLGVGTTALAKDKSTQSEARWVSYDPAAKTVVLKIDKPGKGPNRKKVKRNQEVTFRVVPEGSVLKRTSVTVNAQRAAITDINEGKKVNVYWVPDPENPEGFFARKIDVVLSEEELDRRYPDQD